MPQRWPALLPILTLAAALLAAPMPHRVAAADTVVGNGTPASCTAAALAAAVIESGTVTFSCGDAPATISLASPLAIEAPSVTIDIGAFERIAALAADRGLLPVGAAERTITLRGDGFDSTSRGRVGGQERPTTLVNGSTLRVTLSPADLANAGWLALSVGGAGAELGSVSITVADDLLRLYLPALLR